MDPIMEVASGLISKEMALSQTHSQNIANANTTGYKRIIAFSDVLSEGASTSRDLGAGKLVRTGAAFDLSVENGLLQVAKDGAIGYLTSGSFHRDAEGHLVTQSGWVLQAAGGGDLIAPQTTAGFDSTGKILDAEQTAEAVRLVALPSDAPVSAGMDGVLMIAEQHISDAAGALLKVGYLESSNVSLSDEMVGLMQTVRRIESGQKLVHVYDDLIGNAIQRMGDL